MPVASPSARRVHESVATGSRRSSAWMAVFSSTVNTAAWSGGFTQADHVGGLRSGSPIIGLHVALESMGLEAGALPGLRDEVVMNSAHVPAFAYPVRNHGGGCAYQHPRFHRRQDRRRLPTIARSPSGGPPESRRRD